MKITRIAKINWYDLVWLTLQKQIWFNLVLLFLRRIFR